MSGITRNQSGLYACYAANEASSDVIQYVVIEVLYPAKIVDWSFPYSRLRPSGTYEMSVEIEGKPPPDRILLISDKTGDVLYRDEGGGVKNATIKPVQCGDTGTYHLYVTNDFNSASLDKNVTVYCVPYVNPDKVTTFDTMPRLGETAVLEMHAAGYPQPNFTWSHNGSLIQHVDDGYSSKVTIENTDVNDFGTYLLDMENSVGKSRYIFQIIPSGPPDPPSNLTYIQSTWHSATVSWISGYDYNDTQTFVINNYEDGDFKVLQEFTDASSEYGNIITKTVGKLESDHQYNITVVARNRNGTSGGNVQSISFVTKESSPSIGVIIGVMLSPFVIAFVFSFAIKQSSKWRRRNKYTLCQDDGEKKPLLPGNQENVDKMERNNEQDKETENLRNATKEHTYRNNDQVDGYIAPE
ncbi:hemicentin-1-like [Mercenaria mercenaria]|uniref:hemicentin-1-like n=1 Tax=Mercenaria mercenaria TaxID=6596 RepID=UPI00234EE895|nr:hemicentin-1-like [Mercenaria mercenaria]